MTYNVFGGTLNLTQSNPVTQNERPRARDSAKSRSRHYQHIYITRVLFCNKSVFRCAVHSIYCINSMLQQLCFRCAVRIWCTFSRTLSSVFCPSISTTSSSTCFYGTGCCLSQQPVSSGKLMRDLSSIGGLQ